jgi:hypothetical protein
LLSRAKVGNWNNAGAAMAYPSLKAFASRNNALGNVATKKVPHKRDLIID